MKKKVILLFTITTLLLTSVTAQETLPKITDSINLGTSGSVPYAAWGPDNEYIYAHGEFSETSNPHIIQKIDPDPFGSTNETIFTADFTELGGLVDPHKNVPKSGGYYFTADDGSNYFAVKTDYSGNVQWTHQIDKGAVTEMTVDSNENMYTLKDDGNDTEDRATGSNLLKLASSDGSVLFDKSVVPSDSAIYGVDFYDGHVYVAELTSSNNIKVRKLDTSGNEVWSTNSYPRDALSNQFASWRDTSAFEVSSNYVAVGDNHNVRVYDTSDGSQIVHFDNLESLGYGPATSVGISKDHVFLTQPGDSVLMTLDIANQNVEATNSPDTFGNLQGSIPISSNGNYGYLGGYIFNKAQFLPNPTPSISNIQLDHEGLRWLDIKANAGPAGSITKVEAVITKNGNTVSDTITLNKQSDGVWKKEGAYNIVADGNHKAKVTAYISGNTAQSTKMFHVKRDSEDEDEQFTTSESSPSPLGNLIGDINNLVSSFLGMFS